MCCSALQSVLMVGVAEQHLVLSGRTRRRSLFCFYLKFLFWFLVFIYFSLLDTERQHKLLVLLKPMHNTQAEARIVLAPPTTVAPPTTMLANSYSKKRLLTSPQSVEKNGTNGETTTTTTTPQQRLQDQNQDLLLERVGLSALSSNNRSILEIIFAFLMIHVATL